MSRLKCKVVILPTNDATYSIFLEKNKVKFLSKTGYYHLYLISNRNYDENEWCLITYDKLPHYKGFPEGPLKWDLNAKSIKGEFKKIEATNDPSLDGVPKIPFTWIKEVFILSEGEIKQVFIKMKTIIERYILNIDEKPVLIDNEVVILSIDVKELFNKEDIKKMLNEYQKRLIELNALQGVGLMELLNQSTDDWFNENY